MHSKPAKTSPAVKRARTRAQRLGALQAARLMLLFTPDLCEGDTAHDCLASLLPHIDVLQLRIKPVAPQTQAPGTAGPEAAARSSYDWARRALELCSAMDRAPLVLVDDRVDVAMALRDWGIDGVHLGRADFPLAAARNWLGPDLLIGTSTHSLQQVVLAEEHGADYVGFGPVFASKTKGYETGLGPEAAWVASVGSSLPLFPIGGIDATNVQALADIGRAAVSSAILQAATPARAAQEMAAALVASRLSSS